MEIKNIKNKLKNLDNPKQILLVRVMKYSMKINNKE